MGVNGTPICIWQPGGLRKVRFETVPIGELKHRLPASSSR